MPEGDTYVQAAARLRQVLVGNRLEAVDGVAPVRARARLLVGRKVEAVRTIGKHLLIDLEGEVAVHVWLGMPGRIRVGRLPPGWERHRRLLGEDRGAARVVLATSDHLAVCFAAPTVEVDRRRVIETALARLGPDLLAEEFAQEEYRARASRVPAERIVSEVLLDQRVLAGIGNEYKCEVLFCERIHPTTPWGALTPSQRDALAARARRLMLPNASRRGARVTTGRGERGQETWVYGRGGRPCRRCRSPISQAWLGEPPRVTYWCPRCQPEPA